MKKEEKNNSQGDLFDEKLYSLIKEDEVKFPLFFKNKSENIFTCYFDFERFEQITISKKHEPFLYSLLFGFNEQIRFCKGDIKTFLYTLCKNQIEILSEEYEENFQKVILDRNKFFNTKDYEYVTRELTDSQKNVKHKWKPIEL